MHTARRRRLKPLVVDLVLPPPADRKIDTKSETNHESEKLEAKGSRREKLTDSAYLGAVVLRDQTCARTEENKRDVDVEQGDGEVATC